MKRENNIDALRVLATVMVIAVHVSVYYVVDYKESSSFRFSVGNLYDSFSRVCVPLFVLLSGRYALSEDKNIDRKYYYRHIFRKIYIPTFIWSFFYLLLSYFQIFIKYHFTKNLEDIYLPLRGLYEGVPYYHMWYLYMCMGLYLLVPFLIKIKNKVGEKKFRNIGILFVGIGIGLVLLQEYLIKIGFYNRDDIFRYLKYFWYLNYFKFINYLGYFILGYSLKDVKISWKKLLVVYFIFSTVIFKLVEDSRDLIYYNYNLPLVIGGSLALYLAFNSLNIKYDFSKLSKHTFNIYLVHAGILTFFILIFKYISKETPNPLWYIPFAIGGVFALSFMFSIGLEKLKTKK